MEARVGVRGLPPFLLHLSFLEIAPLIKPGACYFG